MLNFGFYNMDCMEGMKEFPDKYFELAIVDPPYFQGPNKRMYYGQKVNKLNIKRRDYPIIDGWDIPDKTYFDELLRVSQNQIIWGCNYYDYQFGSGRIIWDKVNGNRYVERFYFSVINGWMMPVHWQDEGHIDEIIAWQPLPEPYKEVSE